MMTEKFQIELGGKSITIESGKMAKQADGAVLVTLGGTVVLVTAVCSLEPKESMDYFPLTVEYQEKTYAAGKIPGGFFKREGRPTEREILTARLMDRPIRPLFPDGFFNEVQVMGMVISSDGENDPNVLAVIGASSALTISDIPFDGPVGAARVGRINDQFILNPTYAELEQSSLDIVVACNDQGVLMLEGASREVSEAVVEEAVEYGRQEALKVIDLQRRMQAKIGKPKKAYPVATLDPAFLKQIEEVSLPRIREIHKLPLKEQREEAMAAMNKELVSQFVIEGSAVSKGNIKMALEEIEKEEVQRFIIERKSRVDGRKFNEIRSLSCEVGILPRTHGSGLFTRGQTQSLSIVTLGTSADEQMIEAYAGESYKSFMLHYNFPPFSVGEVKPVRGPGRREIGHGALAEKALKAVMPSKEQFPYTVRVVSDILESNGSSSMATVCAGTLSLMDAGVPIKEPVSGIAMGLVKRGTEVCILTDIAGVEDHHGMMDFKVTGTRNGVTAIQLDVKLKEGLSPKIVEDTLKESHQARMTILDAMLKTIAEPRRNLSAYAPRIITIKIDTGKIGEVIGPGGKTIKKIIEQTGASIDIEDDGTVLVASTDEQAAQKAVDIIKAMTEDPEVGKIYKGKITRIEKFGAFCEILPGKSGLIHVSELSDTFVKNVEDAVKIGDEVLVKLVEIDAQRRLILSRKQAMGDGGKHHKEHKEHHKDKGKAEARR